MNCASCGTENRTGSRFCDNCGTPLASACPSCGEPNRADARFCATCGTRFHEADAVAAPPTAARGPAERRLVSVLFADLVGFTTLAEDRDPEAVRELLTRYFDATTDIVQRHGGTVEKFIGDAVMAVWGTPVAHEDDAERAVRAALELIEGIRPLGHDLQARAAVLTGEAAVTVGAQNQGMVAGDLVNSAARLQGAAEPGTILVGEATMRAAERSVLFEPVGEHSLKGKTTPIPAWRALRVVAQRGGLGRADALEAPFAGRDEELRQLKDVLHAVGRERRPWLVSITGPAGIGKSRLAWELLKYIDGIAEGIYWHRGRSPSYGEGIAFWALGEMVRRRAQLAEDADEATTRERIAAVVSEYVTDEGEAERIGQALLALLGLENPPDGGRDALFPAWRAFIERIAERGTAVLVFEDLQWADTGLLDFLEHLLDWSRNLPILVITLARPDLLDRRPDWGVGRRHLTALALDPLRDAAVREMLDGLVPGLPADAIAAIVGRAEGIPLYAVETVRGMLADGLIERRGDAYVPVGDVSKIRVPESLRSLIAARLDALEPARRALLQDAAVLGQVFSAEALAGVSGSSGAELEPALRDLVRRELLDVERDPASPERGQYKFVQSLIREVAYSTLARRDRRARHLAVARHFEAVGDDELAGALASHYLAAHASSDGGPEADALAGQARLALSGAAERAARLGGHDQALSYLQQALAITTDPAERAPLLDRAARHAGLASREAHVFADEAIEAYRGLGDRVAAAAATARLGRVLLDESEVVRARQVLEAAVPEAEDVGDEPVLAETLANLARVYMRDANLELAIATADRALPIAERLNLEPVVAEALVNKGSAMNLLGRRREAAALMSAALELAERIGDRGLEMRTRNNLAGAYDDDDPARATRMMIEARDLAADVGDRGMHNWLTSMVAVGLLQEGRDLDESISRLRDAFETATLPADRLRLRALRGVVENTRGEGLDQLVAEVTELAGDRTDLEARFITHMAHASTALFKGDHSPAYDAAMAAWELGPQNPEIPLALALHAATWSRDPQRARLAESRVAELPGSGHYFRSLKLRARGAVAALEGRTTEALAMLGEARDIRLRLEQWFDAAQIAVDAAHLLPDEPEVRAWAAEARPLLEQMRARPWLDALDAGLAGGTSATTHRASVAAELPSAG